MIPKPRFLQRRIGEVEIGTFRQIATVQESASVYEALTIFVERRVSALPVVDEQGSPASSTDCGLTGRLCAVVALIVILLFFFFYTCFFQ